MPGYQDAVNGIHMMARKLPGRGAAPAGYI